jgi:hypothetical protein
MFTVALQATVPLDLQDLGSNVAILSRSQPDPANCALTLATYRCSAAIHECWKLVENVHA